MKTLATKIGLSAALMGVLLLAGCSKGEAESYGTMATDAKAVTVANVMKAPETYDGKSVKLQGTIATQCPAGCWFELKDDSGAVHVDIAPHGLAIPPRGGKSVTVTGKVKVDGTQVSVVGGGVEIK